MTDDDDDDDDIMQIQSAWFFICSLSSKNKYGLTNVIVSLLSLDR